MKTGLIVDLGGKVGFAHYLPEDSVSTKTIDAKGRVTLGKQFAGREVVIEETPEGVMLRYVVAVPADQAWFWTERWQKMEREVDGHVARGEVTTHESPEALAEHLERLGES